MPAGRPKKLTAKQQAEVLKAFEDYIKRSYDPTVVGFCSYDPVALQYEINDSNLYDWDEFSGLIKRAIKKQEAYLVEGGTRNQLNVTMAIFRLKQPQHGYTDQKHVDHTTAGKELPTPILGAASGLPANDGDDEAS